MTQTIDDVRPLKRDELLRQCNPDFLKALAFGRNGPLPPRSRTLGPTWVRFVHDNCVMGEGDAYGQPARMTPDQQALFWKLGELRASGRRRFRKALLSLGKGSGKSPVLAWLGNIDLGGHAVFKEWAPNGNPRGKPRVSASVINMASSYEQADLVLDEMRATWDVGPSKARANAMKGAVEMLDCRASAHRIPATPKRADGSKATTLLVDEVHELTTENQERAVNVAEGGTGKRQDSLILWASTAGSDMSTMFGREVARGLRGEFADSELFVYMYAGGGAVAAIATTPDTMFAAMYAGGGPGGRSLDPLDDADVIIGIKQANPLAACGIADVQDLLAKFRGMPLFRAKRYYWNQWVSTDESWLPVGAWDACKSNVVFDPDLPTWVGADMALKRDSAAIIVAQYRPDGRLQVQAKIWFPNGGLIDQTECDDYLRLIKSTHNLQWIAADEAWWPTLGNLEAEGLPIFRMPQQGRNMVLAYAQTYRVIVDAIVAHDGDPGMSDQIASAVPQSTDRGWTLRKGKNKRKIDCCPALAGAVFATTLAPPEKEAVVPRSAVY